MTTQRNSQPTIVVAGDVTLDWHFARTRRSDNDSIWHSNDRTCASCQPGGATLMADLLAAVAAEMDTAWEVAGPPPPEVPPVPGDPRFHHSYALWSRYPHHRSGAASNPRVWRVEEFLGLDAAALAEPPGAPDREAGARNPPPADLLVLDDGGLGFRSDDRRWPAVPEAPAWTVLKMSRPIAQGLLWEHLRQPRYAQRLIVVLRANDLREAEVQISRELSWERTAQDLFWELVHNPRVKRLSACAHVVVSFDTAGAIVLSRRSGSDSAPDDAGGHACRLIFDPGVVERMDGKEHPGGMIGYTSCLVAGIVRHLMLAPGGDDITPGIQAGLAAARQLHREGYDAQVSAPAADPAEPAADPAAPAAKSTRNEEDPLLHVRLAFPTDRIARHLADTARHLADTADDRAAANPPFAMVDIADPVRGVAGASGQQPARGRSLGYWTILEDQYPSGLEAVARRIVEEGVDAALRQVPCGRLGGLITVDRREIESFRSIRTLIEVFTSGEDQRPLSIAVFGAPGAGKSYAITEAARSLLGDDVKRLVFNLAQFEDPEQLHDAFHQVRDAVLEGHLPLVFWDEFDTSRGNQDLAWLRHFLAPMQDGKFYEGQVVHPIGRAVFVFAGGTHESMAKFVARQGEDAFRKAKGPDFVSRLKGYLDIVGPNPHEGRREADPYFIIRRAILLRSMFERMRPRLLQGKRLNIDSGVLRAFLEVPLYRHGARSMESLIATSQLAGHTTFERSGLPAESQLDIHVDGRAFLALVQRLEMTPEVLEQLAEAHHEAYGRSVEGKPTAYGDKAYAELPEDIKDTNRDAVRDIPKKLDSVGYIAIPARSNEPPFGFPGDDLERMAELEHDRWMRQKRVQGWCYGSTPDNKPDPKAKKHPAMLPWDAMSAEARAARYSREDDACIGCAVLPDEEKKKDRDLVSAIPVILARAGYTIVKVRDAQTLHQPTQPGSSEATPPSGGVGSG